MLLVDLATLSIHFESVGHGSLAPLLLLSDGGGYNH